MYYLSTRDKSLHYTPSQAIAQGLSQEGGLFLPNELPHLPEGAIEEMMGMTYQQRAVTVMSLYLPGFSREELAEYAALAYGRDKFDTDAVAPVRKLDDNTWCLELWHGPTCAFKDMALQMLPHLLSASLVKNEEQRTACILVATSGDTGKGALEGFKDVPHTRIMVFYPKDGVSEVQELQMRTQEGDNVGVCSVVGNFDDAQTGVKRLFSDVELRETLDQRGYFFSSANSINWGRVLPQIVYYISAYADLCNQGAIQMGDKVNICVPTGNFGNILAAYYAKCMGLPIGKLICASNSNNILTDFLSTGVYDRNRPFHTTISPSMDILISSNLERLLYALSGEDDKLVSDYMAQLNATGRYEVNDAIKARLFDLFAAGYTSEEETKQTIGRVWAEQGYLMDTHTAVAVHVREQYRAQSGDDTITIVASTASPFKFGDAVLEAIGETEIPSGIALLDKLESVSGVPIPVPLAALKTKQPRFHQCVEKQDMDQAVLGFLR